VGPRAGLDDHLSVYVPVISLTRLMRSPWCQCVPLTSEDCDFYEIALLSVCQYVPLSLLSNGISVYLCLPHPQFFRFLRGALRIKGKQAISSFQNLLSIVLISVIVKTDLSALSQKRLRLLDSRYFSISRS
jgi:hypothetical protein